MISLEELRAKKKERQKFKESLFTRISFILDNDEGKLQEIQQTLEKEKADFIEKKRQELFEFKAQLTQKKKIEVPPFYLIPKEKIQAVEKVMKYANPYFKFANDADELITAYFLYKIDPKIDEKLLKAHNLDNLIYAKLAKDILEEIKAKNIEIKKKEEECQRNCLKEIGEKFGIAYEDNTNVAEFFTKIIDKARNAYIEDTLLKTFGAKNLESITEKIISEFENKKEKYDEYVNILKINKKDILVSKSLGTLEVLIKKKLEMFINDDKIETEIYKATPDLIGKKVRIYPGGDPKGEEYDYGENIKKVPAGSEGIIVEIRSGAEVTVKLKEQGLGWTSNYVNLSKVPQEKLSFYKGNFWYVTPREIKILENPLVAFMQEKYGLNESVAEGIFKNNYEQILKEYSKQKLAKLEQEKLKLMEMKKYLTKFIVEE
ncbi:MAG: hypothetical protein QXW65_01080 [Candidatus Pacearchaeota archaeon]